VHSATEEGVRTTPICDLYIPYTTPIYIYEEGVRTTHELPASSHAAGGWGELKHRAGVGVSGLV